MNRSKKSSTSAFQVSEDIVPIGELKAHLSARIRDLKATRRPLVVTQHGKAAAVMLAPDEFDRLMSQLSFMSAVQEGIGDLEAGRVVRDEDLVRRLDARFGSRKISEK